MARLDVVVSEEGQHIPKSRVNADAREGGVASMNRGGDDKGRKAGPDEAGIDIVAIVQVFVLPGSVSIQRDGYILTKTRVQIGFHSETRPERIEILADGKVSQPGAGFIEVIHIEMQILQSGEWSDGELVADGEIVAA